MGDIKQITEAFQRRLDIYVHKHETANPLGDDIYSRWSATKYVVEALCYVAHDCGLDIKEPDWLNDIVNGYYGEATSDSGSGPTGEDTVGG